jgi:toxin-antitoxin system PIN domain toxin
LSKPWLLDVNVMLAWLWPAHEVHKAAQAWMHTHRQEPWATCPVTEMGFLRILTNQSFSPNAPKWPEAVKILRKQTADSPSHSFWQDSLSLAEVDLRLGSRIKGPNQITDAYLLAMAVHNKGRFVTFDYRTRSLAPDGSAEHDALVVLHADARHS